jgi:hypothetical protein
MVAVEPWGVRERLAQEKTALGFYLRAICSTRTRPRCASSASAASPT